MNAILIAGLITAGTFLVIAYLETSRERREGKDVTLGVAATGLGSFAVCMFCAVALLARLAGL
jgi:hypothetical protein